MTKINRKPDTAKQVEYDRQVISKVTETLGAPTPNTHWSRVFDKTYHEAHFNSIDVENMDTLMKSLKTGEFSFNPDGAAGVTLSLPKGMARSGGMYTQFHLRFLNMKDDIEAPPDGHTAFYRIRVTPEHTPLPIPLITGTLTVNRSDWHRHARLAAIIGGRYDAQTEWMTLLGTHPDAEELILYWVRSCPTTSSLAMLRDLLVRDDSPYRDTELLKLVRDAQNKRNGWSTIPPDRKIRWNDAVSTMAVEHYKHLLTQASKKKG